MGAEDQGNICDNSPKFRQPRGGLGGVGATLARFVKGDRSPASKLIGILAYSFCSSTMLVVNKITVGHMHVPTAVRCAGRVRAWRGRKRRQERAFGACGSKAAQSSATRVWLRRRGALRGALAGGRVGGRVVTAPGRAIWRAGQKQARS
jgi:hypothetical protein